VYSKTIRLTFSTAIPKSWATGVAEPHWLVTLLARCREVLLRPASAATQAVWAESVKRCDALRQLLEAGNYALAGRLKIAPFGTPHEIS